VLVRSDGLLRGRWRAGAGLVWQSPGWRLTGLVLDCVRSARTESEGRTESRSEREERRAETEADREAALVLCMALIVQVQHPDSKDCFSTLDIMRVVRLPKSSYAISIVNRRDKGRT